MGRRWNLKINVIPIFIQTENCDCLIRITSLRRHTQPTNLAVKWTDKIEIFRKLHGSLNIEYRDGCRWEHSLQAEPLPSVRSKVGESWILRATQNCRGDGGGKNYNVISGNKPLGRELIYGCGVTSLLSVTAAVWMCVGLSLWNEAVT